MELDGEKRGTCSRWTEWERGTVRTLANLQSNYEAWCAETGEDKKRLPDYKSCQYPPIDLYGWEYQDEKILVLYTPMPLHLLLGSGNSCLRMLEDTYQDFHKFYEMWGVSKVSFDFSGRDLKVLLSDDQSNTYVNAGTYQNVVNIEHFSQSYPKWCQAKQLDVLYALIFSTF